MGSNASAVATENDQGLVGPFTGFGNFLHKEFFDWWKSWRLVVVATLMTVVMLLFVFFGYSTFQQLHQMQQAQAEQFGEMKPAMPPDLMGASFLLLSSQGIIFLPIIIIIFSTMGLLTTEKSTGTLAWNLTKPLGRTGLLTAKWLAATTLLWMFMYVAPLLISVVCMVFYNHVTPNIPKMLPIMAAAFAWIGLWVLFGLTISLFFQSQAAVAGILFAFWIIPNIFVALLVLVLGKESSTWIDDRLATNAASWAFQLFADDDLFIISKRETKNVWIYAFAVWTLVLSVFSIRVFNRQEIGS